LKHRPPPNFIIQMTNYLERSELLAQSRHVIRTDGCLLLAGSGHAKVTSEL
jgi:hypothetical protein